MRSVEVGRALRGLVVAVVILVGNATAAVALPPPGQPEPAKPRTPLSDVAKTPEPEIPQKSWRVDARGTFGDSIPIEVPAFRRITPQLSLAYESSGGNGWTGVGWSLRGVGEIERTGAGRGAPRYDATDGYVLDGEELVPCAAGSVSPSCTTGGTHSTKNESYARYTLSGTGSDSRWTVVAKDGTKRVYAPVYDAGSGQVFRWGLSQVVDTLNNTVTYHWAKDQFGCCYEYLDSVTYGGTTVELHYEARPDNDQRAVGNGGLATVRGRVKTIDVTVGGSRLRAYKLTYATSGATSRSLLTRVQQFGKDAAVDASGTVTGGTSLPAVTAAYQALDPAFVAGTSDTAMGSKTDAKYLPMDINGDGRTDLLEMYPGWTFERHSWLSNGTTFTLASNDTGMPIHTETRFLAGDVNGDGRSDLIEIYPNGFSWGRRLYLSNGTGFTQASSGASKGGYSEDSRFLAMDVNGDGKTDLVELYQCGIFPVHYCRATSLSTGADFTLASNDTGIPFNADRQFLAADVNGDGRSDLLELYPAGFTAGGRRIWLSNGTGFVAGATDTGMNWSTPEGDGTGSRFLVLDVNGDDKDDMVELYPFMTTYTRRTWISTGYGFTLGATDSAMPQAGTARQLVVDVNGDQRADMVELAPYGLSTRRRIWLSTGAGWVAGPTDTSIPAISCAKDGSCNSDFLGMDVDGDGLGEMTALYTAPFGLSKSRRVWSVAGSVPDLLTSSTGVWGAATTVAYTPSSAWTNTNNPPLVQTASAVTVDDGRGGTATTRYSYAGGAYDRAERRFLGFRQSRQTQPCLAGETTCPYTETWFRQDLGALGNPERVERHAGDGALLTATIHEYTTNGTTVPRTALPTGTWENTYAGSGTACPGADCRREYTTRQYNAYGEVTQQVERGDNEIAGDERTTVTTFVPNPTAYIAGLPVGVTMFEGVGTSGSKLTETRSYYDGATTWNQPPTAGFETKNSRWLSTTDTFVDTGKEYDSWGNLTAEINPLGSRTTLGYDPAYHLFQTSETNALSQQVTATWDAGCGVPTHVTDLDNQPTTLSYDVLCRLSDKTEPGGRFERHTWVNVGNPATQYEQIERPAADGTSNPQWSRRYVDGLRRPWRAAATGPDAATGDIYTDMAYNARGQEASRTAAYYWVSGQPQPATFPTTSSYDTLDRLTRTTFPGGAHRDKGYHLWSVTDTDERGRATTDRLDAYDQRVAREQTVDGVTRTAGYVFDLRGGLVRSTDPSGYVISYAKDSLGRTTKMVDPDSGTTTYEWDDAGWPAAQTDARNQRTTFSHDVLGRKTGKTSNAGTASAVSVSWTYDQVRAGYHNAGKLTSMTDAAGTRTFDHDALGHVVKTVRTINGTSYAFGYGFDAGGRKLWTTYPDGDTQGTAASPLRYDGAGRLVSIPGYVTSAGYTADGNLTRIENANGTVITRPYDAQRGWLNGIKTMSGGTTIQDNTYTRDANGKIMQIAGPLANESWTYGYDEAGQLTSATNGSGGASNQTVGYDGTGNITANSRLGDYAYGTAHPHAVTSAGANSYSYNAAGLMTSGAGRTLTWNGDNQLASVTRNGTTTTYTYDADAARIQQSDGTTTHRYLGDDYEVDVTAGSTSKYISVAGTLVARKDGGTRYWVHVDQQGSVQAVTDAAGNEVHRKQFSAFGEPLSSGGTLAAEPRGFTGERADASGLVYLKTRFYDPELGRFVSPNPVIDGDGTIGLNRYAYAANDPVNNTDPTGFDCSDNDGGSCELDLEFKKQQTGWWCGPAATRNALSALGVRLRTNDDGEDVEQRELTAPDDLNVPDHGGTDTIELVQSALNRRVGWFPHYRVNKLSGDPDNPGEASTTEKTRFRDDVIGTLRSGRPVVANIFNTRPIKGAPDNLVYDVGHYVTIIGFRNGGDEVHVADPAGYAPDMYWVPTDSMATWVVSRGYTY